MITETELWAQDGIERQREGRVSLGDELREPGVEWDQEVALAFVRAAYGKGYADALTEPSPLTVEEAAAREQSLRLTLPV